jgi:D-threo-aldose 1-dehydrogenase
MSENNLPFTARRVGRTGLQVSMFGFGASGIANLYRAVSEAEAEAAVHYALEQGVRLFDTAPLYGVGVSERRVGAALAGVPRERYVLATKVGRIITSDENWVFDYSSDGVRRSLEASLERLKLDHVDIVHIHDPDDHYRQALDEAFPALAELRSQGVIKAIGAGMNQWQMLYKFAENADFDCFLLAGRYTLLEQGALKFLEMCQQEQISVFAAGIYNSGVLATGAVAGAKFQYEDAPPEILAKVRRLQAVCDRHNVPLNAAALQFVAAHRAFTSLIVGAESAAQYAETIAASQIPIPTAFWAELRAENLIEDSAPVPQA